MTSKLYPTTKIYTYSDCITIANQYMSEAFRADSRWARSLQTAKLASFWFAQANIARKTGSVTRAI